CDLVKARLENGEELWNPSASHRGRALFVDVDTVGGDFPFAVFLDDLNMLDTALVLKLCLEGDEVGAWQSLVIWLLARDETGDFTARHHRTGPQHFGMLCRPLLHGRIL